LSSYITDYHRYLWQLLNGFRAGHERILAAIRERDVAAYVGRHSLSVLDLANGRRCTELTESTVQDWIDVGYKLALLLYAWQLRVSVKIVAFDILTCADVCAWPFRENSFDLVSSVAAFEHFLDVSTIVA